MLLKARFLRRDGLLTECTVSGHDAYTEDIGFSVLCAAVSSAVQLTSAMLECFGAPDECVSVQPAKGSQNQIVIRLNKPDPVHANILKGLLLHFQALAEDYDGSFSVTVSETGSSTHHENGGVMK